MRHNALPLVVIAMIMMFGLVAFLVGVADSSSGWNIVLFFQGIFVLLLSFGPLVFFKQNVPFISTRTGVGIVFGLVFGIWPIAYMVSTDVSGGYISLWVSSADDYFIETLWYAIIGVLCFQVSYLLPFGQRLAKKINPPKIGWSRNRIVVVSVVATIASLVSAVAVWSQVGSGGSAMALFGRAKVVLDGFHYLALGFALLRISILVSWAYSIVRKFPRSIILGQVVLYSVFILYLGGRNQVISLWIMLLLIYVLLTPQAINFRKVSSLRVFSWGTIVVVGAIVLLVVIRGFRTTYDTSTTGLDVAILQNLIDSLADISTSILQEFDQLEVFATIVAIIPDRLAFLFGKSYLDIFSLPIPRSLWPDKPIPARLILGQMMRSADVGIPPTIIGEFFFNFGLLGVIFGMSLFGIICKALDSWAYLYRNNPTAIIFFAFVLANLPIIITRYFYGWFGGILIFSFGLWIVCRFLYTPGSRNAYSANRPRPRTRTRTG